MAAGGRATVQERLPEDQGMIRQNMSLHKKTIISNCDIRFSMLYYAKQFSNISVISI